MSDDETKPQLEETTEKEEEQKDVEENASDDKVETKDEPSKEEEMEVDTTKEEKEEEEEEEEDKQEEEKVEEKETVKETKQETPVKDTPETPPKAADARPLYDQPLEMSGKRDRKKVERFVQETKKEELEAAGRGTPFGDIPFINAMIMKMQTDDLKVLHRVAYSRPGSGSEVKKNLKKFNGFPFTKEDKKYGLKLTNVERILMSEIKKMLQILGLERAGNKGDAVERLMDFMLLPEDKGRKPPREKKSGKGRGRPKKGTQERKKKNNTSTESAKSDESESDGSDESGEEQEEEEEEEEKPKKAPKKTPAKKTPAKRATSAKKATPAKRSKASVASDSDSDSDDEPLAKKVKQPPSDIEIKGMVKKILDGANLEEITMKSVCRQVYDSYPDFDLTHKKDFIKETVKSIIS